MPKNQSKKLKKLIAKDQSYPGARKGSEAHRLMSEMNNHKIVSARAKPVKGAGEKGDELLRNVWRISWAAGIGHAPKKQYKPGTHTDSHVWLQKGDHIIDPTPADTSYAGCKQHYKAWEGKSKVACFMDWKKRYEQVITENLVSQYMEHIKEKDIMEYIEIMNDAGAQKKIFKACSDKFKMMMKANPPPRQCYYNVMACKDDHPGYKVMFGSMGYEVEPGRVFWEFG